MALGVLACALLLTGCAEKHEASTTLPPVSADAAASPSEGITAKVLPAVGPTDFPVPIEARQQTPAGAVAFIRYYVDLMNRQSETLDSQPLRDLSRNCHTCTALANTYDQNKAAGYRYDGGAMRLVSPGSAVVQGDEAQAAFVLEQSAISLRDQTGAAVPSRSFPDTKYTGAAILKWDDHRTTWLVTQLDVGKL